MVVGFFVGSVGFATLTTGAGGVILTVEGFFGVDGVVAGLAAGFVAAGAAFLVSALFFVSGFLVAGFFFFLSSELFFGFFLSSYFGCS